MVDGVVRPCNSLCGNWDSLTLFCSVLSLRNKIHFSVWIAAVIAAGVQALPRRIFSIALSRLILNWAPVRALFGREFRAALINRYFQVFCAPGLMGGIADEGPLVIAPFLPSPLIEKLDSEGFESRVERQVGGGWAVHFWHEK